MKENLFFSHMHLQLRKKKIQDEEHTIEVERPQLHRGS